jgi:ribosomal protein S9
MTGDRPGTIRSDALMHRIKDVMLDAVLLAVKEQRANPGDMTMLVCMSGFIGGADLMREALARALTLAGHEELATQIRDDTFDVPLAEILVAAAKEGV